MLQEIIIPKTNITLWSCFTLRGLYTAQCLINYSVKIKNISHCLSNQNTSCYTGANQKFGLEDLEIIKCHFSLDSPNLYLTEYLFTQVGQFLTMTHYKLYIYLFMFYSNSTLKPLPQTQHILQLMQVFTLQNMRACNLKNFETLYCRCLIAVYYCLFIQ